MFHVSGFRWSPGSSIWCEVAPLWGSWHGTRRRGDWSNFQCPPCLSSCVITCVLPKQVDKGKIRVNSVIKMYKSPPIHPRISGRRSFRLRGSLFLGSTWTRVGRRQGLGLPENQEWNGDWIETYLYIFSQGRPHRTAADSHARQREREIERERDISS